MYIIKNTVGIVLLATVFSIASANQAHAGFFDNSSTWSFDSLYQNIQGITAPANDSTIQSNAVASVTSPATSKTKAKAPKKTYMVSASAYSSSVDETDSTPFITAAGTYVRDGIVATNFLPIGTAIKIPDIYGDKIFVVEDRMNTRYWMNVDLWFPSKELAKQFGRKTVKIEVVS
jgi:3D (Asp-Asp-Asp) domain-containing protein